MISNACVVASFPWELEFMAIAPLPRSPDPTIAAAAIEQGYAVLTGNVRHFQTIPGLQVVSFR
jgi:predicted nucleic acid-binding protein